MPPYRRNFRWTHVPVHPIVFATRTGPVDKSKSMPWNPFDKRIISTLDICTIDVKGTCQWTPNWLVVGGRIGLWEEFLLQWLQLMREARPEISIRAESGLEPELMQGLVDGRIDIGVMYTPQKDIVRDELISGNHPDDAVCYKEDPQTFDWHGVLQ
jgi:hypothetical protein